MLAARDAVGAIGGAHASSSGVLCDVVVKGDWDVHGGEQCNVISIERASLI